MPFEYPDPVLRWVETPQYRLRVELKEKLHYSLGTIGRNLPGIINMMKKVGDPDLVTVIKLLQGTQAYVDRVLSGMPALIRYCEQQAEDVKPGPKEGTPSTDELKECENCEAMFEGHRLSKYCCPECREEAHAKRAGEREKKKAGKVKR